MIESIKRIMSLKKEDIYFKRIIYALFRRISNVPHFMYFYLPLGFYKENRKRLASFKDIHKCERCFIIANGPSLGKIDFNLLKDEFTIGMNRIYLMHELNGFMPNYLVCIDEKTQIQQFHKELDKLGIPCFFNFNLRHKFSKKSNQYFIKGKFSPAFSKDLSFNPHGNGKTVTYAAIQLAFHMGFTEVYLVGKDHSYRTTAPAGTGIMSDGKEGNHFIKGYYLPGQTWDAPDYKSEEFAYRLAKNEFERNRRIINDATYGGNLFVFDKVDFNSLFQDTILR